MTESAHSEHIPAKKPESTPKRQHDPLRSTVRAGSELAAPSGARHQHQMQQSDHDARVRVSEGSRDASPSHSKALASSIEGCGCSNQSNGLLSVADTLPNGGAADYWRGEAVFQGGSPVASKAEKSSEGAAKVPLSPVQSRSWWPHTATEDTTLHESESSVTSEASCARQAGEAIGEYVMYRF